MKQITYWQVYNPKTNIAFRLDHNLGIREAWAEAKRLSQAQHANLTLQKVDATIFDHSTVYYKP